LQDRIPALGLLQREVVRLGKAQVFWAANPMNPRKVGRDKVFAVIPEWLSTTKTSTKPGAGFRPIGGAAPPTLWE